MSDSGSAWDWLTSDSWQDYRQQQQLRDLDASMSAARSESHRLRSQLSQVQGGLESRLEKLAKAFDAFVELSDVRQDLIVFADAADVRRHAGATLSALASGKPAPAARDDVPGYWLAPAVTALAERATGGAGTDALTEALARDDRRTAIFCSLSLAALGRRDAIDPAWFDLAFGELAADRTVNGVQRALWVTAARGGFDQQGAVAMAERLGSLVSPEGSQRLAEVLATKTAAGSVSFDHPEIEAQWDAAGRLSGLRERLEKITGDTSLREPDPALAREDGPSGVLRLLIAEGSDPERELLARVAELRATITGDAADNGSIDDPVSPLDELLATDLGGTGQPHLAAMALRVAAPTIATHAEKLAEQASQPCPEQIRVKVDRSEVVLHADGRADQESVGAGVASTTQAVTLRTSRGERVAAVGMIAGGVVAALGLGLLHWIWIPFALVLSAFGAHKWWKLRAQEAADRKFAADRAAEFQKHAATAAERYGAFAAGADDRIAAAKQDLAAVTSALP